MLRWRLARLGQLTYAETNFAHRSGTIADDTVTVKRADPLDAGFLKLSNENFSDWNSPDDDEAFRDL